MTPGIHRIPMAAYLADPCPAPSLTAGLAHTLITRSALHAKYEHPKLSPHYAPRQDEKFDLGTAAHSLILEGDDKVCAIDADDWRTKAAKEQREEARSKNLVPLLRKHYEAVRKMVSVARSFMLECEIAKSLEAAEPELTITWEESGLWFRARPDLWSKDRKVLVNYKTCELAEPNAFIRRIPSLGYDLSAAFYERGAKALGFKASEFFLAQETTPPYSCSLIGLDPAMREIAIGKVNHAIASWRAYLSGDHWPAYPKHVCYATPSTWELAQHEERLLVAEEA